MFLADYHVHSDISQDSKATMFEMVEAEAKMGMEQMCFTNHCDMVNWRTYQFNPDCLTKPAETLEKYAAMLQEQIGGREQPSAFRMACRNRGIQFFDPM